MFHCKVCNSCMDFHHKHSDFLGKCIGNDNAIAYFWFLVTSMAINILLVVCLADCIGHNTDQEPSGALLKLVSCMVAIYEQNLVFLGSIFLFASYSMLSTLDKLLQFSLSIANRATVRELGNLWSYPHLFKVERDDSVTDQVELIHREISELESGR